MLNDMGSQISGSDEEHLLTDADEVPLFEKINIVLIGHHEAGKNTIGNTILRKKAFTRWNINTGHSSQADNTIFGRRVSLIHVPGWSEDLSPDDIKQMKLRQVIKDSVKSFKHGPHVIILVVKNNNMLTRTTRTTLEKLLSDNFSKHTLVFSMDGEKISFIEMKEHCKSGKQTEINICRNRYHLFKRCPCGKQNLVLIEAIEDFIARKDLIHFFPMDNETPNPELQVEQLDKLVNRLNQRISALSESISKLQSDNQIDADELRTKIELKNDKKSKLDKLLREKKRVLEGLRSTLSTTEPSVLQIIEKQPGNEERQRQKKHQRKKNKELRRKNTDTQKEETLKYRSHLEGTEGPQIQTNVWRKRTVNSQAVISDDEGLAASESYTDDEGPQASESHRESTSDDEGPHTSEHRGPHNKLPSDFLRGWTYKLNSIMEELTEDQFKRMIHMMQMRDTWRIPAGHLDGRGRASVTQLLVQKWGEHQCIINTRDIMKDIPRNDSVIRVQTEIALPKDEPYFAVVKFGVMILFTSSSLYGFRQISFQMLNKLTMADNTILFKDMLEHDIDG
ncbi:hypothetical protein MHYP_G00012720 [Metynnis hypsauchen]